MSDYYRTLIKPQQPQDIPLRPLSKGMRRDIPSNAIEPGGFYDLKNVLARTEGLQRRAGMLNALGGATITFPPVRLIRAVWLLNGLQYTALIDSRMLYYFSTAFSLVKHTYSTGTVTCTIVGGVTRATGAGTLWNTAASDVKVGDVFYCATLTGTNKYGVVKTINSDTQLDLETDEGTVGAGAAYEIRRSIRADTQKFPDAIALDGKLIIVDGNREARSFDPGTSLTVFGYYSADATYDLWPHCVCFFKDRIFYGRPVETSGTEDNRQRVRWTTTLSYSVLPVLQFVDLPYTPGFIRRLVGLENALVCYMNDAVWLGRITNFGDQLPVAFDTKLETGGMGLIGDRAVLPYLGGHFIVLEDNIYFLNGANGQLEAIGDPIKEMFFADPEALWSVQIEADPANTRLLFTEPSVSGGFSKLFSFDYRAKAWSYEENAGSFLSRAQIGTVLSYDAWLTAPPYTYDTGLGVFPSYDSIGIPGSPLVYLGFSNFLRYYGTATVTEDPSPTGAVSVSIESGDFDYGQLDDERIHLRLSLKLKEVLTSDLVFSVFTSTDEGGTWKQVRGRQLTIPAGELENYVSFRAKGSAFRFKLTSTSSCPVFTVKEIVLRAVGAGVEAHLAANR